MSDYYSDISRVSNSMLKLLADDKPELFFKQYEQGRYIPSEPSPAMQLGHIVHCLTLEPHLFTERYAVMPDIDGRTKEGKQIKAELAASGKKVVSNDDYEKAQTCAAKLRAHDEFSTILDLPDNEIEQRIDFDWNGTPCRCKVDLINKRRRLIIDIKTTQNASPTEFAKSVSIYGYHCQNAFYEEAARQRDGFDYRFIFACVETSPPFSVALHQLDDADIATGGEEITKLIDELHDRREKRFWLPEWSRGINNITLPRWHKQREVIEV